MLVYNHTSSAQEKKSLCVCNYNAGIQVNNRTELITVVLDKKYCNYEFNHSLKDRERNKGKLQTAIPNTNNFGNGQVHVGKCRYIADYVDPGPLLARIKYLEDQIKKDREQNLQLFKVLKKEIEEK